MGTTVRRRAGWQVGIGIVGALAGGCTDAGVTAGGVDAGAADVPTPPADLAAIDVTAEDVLRCGPGQTACDGVCASTQVDPANCGACGRRCGDLERCNAGQCAPACPAAQTLCTGDAGARCVLTATDREHCGACGRACAAGEVCSDGACTASCAAPLMTCADDRGQRGCADLQRDPRHCGACNSACAPGFGCEGGRCQIACGPGLIGCRDGADGGVDAGAMVCADPLSNPRHCGACNNACLNGESCVMGRCTLNCAAGFTACAGACRDLQTDRAHCGACGNACTAGESCVAGRCELVCPAGFVNCGGACRDTETDRAHCGACDNACPAGESCANGRCELVCPSGLTACAGRCVVTTTDPAHCGACGNACPAAPNGTSICAAGRCGVLCAAGFADCNGMLPDGCELAVGEACTVGAGPCARPGLAGCVGGAPRCVGTPGTPGVETCNNVDDDCDGATDESLTQTCYTGPTGTAGVGVCRRGTQTCAAGSFGACAGQVLPSAEVCDGMDNDCNGAVDNGLTRSCYTGPAGTAGTGACRAGTQTCAAGAWGPACVGEVIPASETCGNGVDENCNGMADEGCQGNGASCRAPIIVTASASFSRNTCMDAGDSGSDTSCGTTGSPEHVYLVRLQRASTVVVNVSGFISGGNEGDILYRGTGCPGSPLACTQHNTELRQNLAAGDHYFFIEDDHAACQPYTVTFGIL